MTPAVATPPSSRAGTMEGHVSRHSSNYHTSMRIPNTPAPTGGGGVAAAAAAVAPSISPAGGTATINPTRARCRPGPMQTSSSTKLLSSAGRMGRKAMAATTAWEWETALAERQVLVELERADAGDKHRTAAGTCMGPGATRKLRTGGGACIPVGGTQQEQEQEQHKPPRRQQHHRHHQQQQQQQVGAIARVRPARDGRQMGRAGAGMRTRRTTATPERRPVVISMRGWRRRR